MFGGLNKCQDCDAGIFAGDGKCAQCHGTGINTQLDSIQPACPYCKGTGKCSTCNGSGTITAGEKNTPRVRPPILRFTPDRIAHRVSAAVNRRDLIARGAYVALVVGLWAKAIDTVLEGLKSVDLGGVYFAFMVGGLAAVLHPVIESVFEDNSEGTIQLRSEQVDVERWRLTGAKAALLVASLLLWGVCALALAEPRPAANPDAVLADVAREICPVLSETLQENAARSSWFNRDSVGDPRSAKQVAVLRQRITRLQRKLATVTFEGSNVVKSSQKEQVQRILALCYAALGDDTLEASRTAFLVQTIGGTWSCGQ